MQLNSLIKNNKKKIRVGRGIGSGKGRPHQEDTKVKNLDQALPLKVLREVKCHYIEDYLREDLKH